MSQQAAERVDVAVIGAGFAGLLAAITIRNRGHESVVVIDAGTDVGGTWRDNTYPGAGCDVASHLYSYSFALKPDWTHRYARQPEILDYLRDVVHRYGLASHLRLDQQVTEARWDEDTARWNITTHTGHRYAARVLIPAVGPLRDPKFPGIDGLEDFAGEVVHTARWPQDLDLTGKRVGVIGTGASAIQLVPAIVDDAAQVHLYQRTPAWVMPRFDAVYAEKSKRRFARSTRALRRRRRIFYAMFESRWPSFSPRGRPLMRLAERLGRRVLRTRVTNPSKREALTPDYAMGCKRILVSDDFHAAVDRETTTVHAGGAVAATSSGLVDAAQTATALDVIVCATGFQVEEPLGQLSVIGVAGQSLRERWGPRPEAYWGTAVDGFPNAFIMIGPNTGLGHNSMIFMMEAQVRIVADLVDQALAGNGQIVTVRPEALRRFVDEVDRRHEKGIWASGCESWYLSEDGTNFTLWPGSTLEFWWRTRRADLGDFCITARGAAPPHGAVRSTNAKAHA